MRKLETVQKQQNLNTIYAMGNKSNGGANHEYWVDSLEPCVHSDEYGLVHKRCAEIIFQTGARKEVNSIHGVIDSDLLEIVKDRLTSFQQGEFASEYNEQALYHIEEALKWMNKRVEDRINRNVLGTYNK